MPQIDKDGQEFVDIAPTPQAIAAYHKIFVAEISLEQGKIAEAQKVIDAIENGDEEEVWTLISLRFSMLNDAMYAYISQREQNIKNMQDGIQAIDHPEKPPPTADQ